MGEKASERKRGTIEGLEGTEEDTLTLQRLRHVAALGLPRRPALPGFPARQGQREGGQGRSGVTRTPLATALPELQGRGSDAVLVLLSGLRDPGGKGAGGRPGARVCERNFASGECGDRSRTHIFVFELCKLAWTRR
jgi:hypothetical protein